MMQLSRFVCVLQRDFVFEESLSSGKQTLNTFSPFSLPAALSPRSSSSACLGEGFRDGFKYVRMGVCEDRAVFVPVSRENCVTVFLQQPICLRLQKLMDYGLFVDTFYDCLPPFVTGMSNYFDIMSRKLIEYTAHDRCYDCQAAFILHLSFFLRVTSLYSGQADDCYILAMTTSDSLFIQLDELETSDYVDYLAMDMFRTEVANGFRQTYVTDYVNTFLIESLDAFTYFSLRTFERTYLIRDVATGRLAEIPIWLYARVAMELNTPCGTTAVVRYDALRGLKRKHNERYFVAPAEDINDVPIVCDIEGFTACFDAMYRKQYIHATPTLINAGLRNNAQLSSCFLHGQVPNDAPYDGTFDAINNATKVMQHCGGVGISLDGQADVVTVARALDSMMNLVKQRRPSALAVYLDIASFDVYRFLELRRNVGRTEAQCQRLFTALFLNDTFLRRVVTNGTWTLIHPDKMGELGNLYGRDYTMRYEALELELVLEGVLGRDYHVTSAKELMTTFMRSQIETGMPFICHRDVINRCSPHVKTPRSYLPEKDRGLIVCSNLCTEIVQYSDRYEYGVCNLANIGLPTFVLDHFGESRETMNAIDRFRICDANDETRSAELELVCQYISNSVDWAGLERTVRLVVVMLNRVLLRTSLCVLEAERGLYHQRAIAIGVQGFAEMLQRLLLPFDSFAARLLNIVLFRFIYTVADHESVGLCARDSYPHDDDYLSVRFDHPNVHQFWMEQRDGVDATRRFSRIECEAMSSNRDTVLLTKIGERHVIPLSSLLRSVEGQLSSCAKRANSLLIGLMPTATTAQILGYSESIDPVYSNVFHRNTQAGDFVQYNELLLDVMARFHPTSSRKQLIGRLVEHDGSVATLGNMPAFYRRIFATAWDLPMRSVIDMCADRQPWVDQTQSMSLYMKGLKDYTRLYLALIYGWARCLKTGMYYLRTYDENTDKAKRPSPTSQPPSGGENREKKPLCDDNLCCT